VAAGGAAKRPPWCFWFWGLAVVKAAELIGGGLVSLFPLMVIVEWNIFILVQESMKFIIRDLPFYCYLIFIEA